MIKILFFDFDGVLVDTKQLYERAIHKILREEGVNFSERQFEEVFGLRLKDILMHFGIKAEEEIEELSERIRKEVLSQKIDITPEIRIIKELKVKKVIASNTITKNIKEILGESAGLFDEIFGGEKFEHKERFIKKYLKKNNFKKSEAIYTGDMVRDVKVAREAGCLSAVISHKMSWDSRDKLVNAGADFLIESLKDLKEIIKSLE